MFTSRTTLARAARCALVFFGCTTPLQAQTVTWNVPVGGDQQAPPVNTPATGNAVVTLDTQTNLFSWHVVHQGLTGNHTASHFHGPALPGQNAGVQVGIGVGNPIVGSTTISAQQASDLLAGLWYVNLHTSTNPGGEIRGQVDPPLTPMTSWCFTLDGSQPVPPNGSAASGEGHVTLDTQTNLLTWFVTHQGLTGAHTASHFHGPALPGQNAGVQVGMGVGNPLVGSAPITQQQANDLLAGLWYVNLHTTVFPAGEIRGQVEFECFSVQCTALGNSWDPTGARLATAGSLVAANGALELNATGVPPFQFGFLLIASVSFPP